MTAVPTATYRLQFHGGFTFAQARGLVPYLARLGISHVYASPFFPLHAAERPLIANNSMPAGRFVVRLINPARWCHRARSYSAFTTTQVLTC